MRVLICGDRNWTDTEVIEDLIIGLGSRCADLVLIEGCAKGADHTACVFDDPVYCRLEHAHYPADWTLHGKAAGPIRNAQMLSEGMPEVVYAFHDDLEHSKGTKDMVTKAKRAHVPVYLISHP